jgi:uridine kinase
MTPRHASAEEAIAAVVALPRGRTVLVGIDGFGGSGKSTLTRRIAAEVPGSVVVEVDDFSGPSVADCAWEWHRLRAQVLVPLLAGRPGRYQRWDWRSDSAGDWLDVPVGRTVLIEGVSSTRQEVAAPWDLTIWVDAPRDLRLQRALDRDGAEMLDRWLTDWMPSEEAYAARERPQERVDLIVRGSEQ